MYYLCQWCPETIVWTFFQIRKMGIVIQMNRAERPENEWKVENLVIYSYFIIISDDYFI